MPGSVAEFLVDDQNELRLAVVETARIITTRL